MSNLRLVTHSFSQPVDETALLASSYLKHLYRLGADESGIPDKDCAEMRKEALRRATRDLHISFEDGVKLLYWESGSLR